MTGDRADHDRWTVEGDPRIVFETPFFSLVAEDVRSPRGTTTTYYRYADEREGCSRLLAVLAICRNDRGEIAIARQWSVPLRAVQDEFPAGGALPDETLESAVLRELREETGIVGANVRWIGRLHNDVRRSSLLTHVALIDAVAASTSSPEDTEDGDWAWVPATEVDELVRDGALTNASLLAAWCVYRSAD